MPQMPIGWFGLTADTAPYTIVGAINWGDITVAADVRLPKSSTGESTSIGERKIVARLLQGCCKIVARRLRVEALNRESHCC